MAAFSTIASVASAVLGAATKIIGGGGKGGGGGGGGNAPTPVDQKPPTDPAAEAAKRRAAGTSSDLTGGLDLGDPELKKPKLGGEQDTKATGGGAGGGLLD